MPRRDRRQRAATVLAILTGTVLFIIGVRFLLVPTSAARFFGLTPDASVPALHYVVALRDLWLGALVVALALFGEWRAVALWLWMAVAVCFGDAVIVASASTTGMGARLPNIVFHVGSGIFCGWLGWLCWNLRIATPQKD